MSEASIPVDPLSERARLGFVHGMLDKPSVWDRVVALADDRFEIVAPAFPWGSAPAVSAAGSPDAVATAFPGSLPHAIVAHSRGAYEVVRHLTAAPTTPADGRPVLVLAGWANQTAEQSRRLIPDGDDLLAMCRTFVSQRAEIDGVTLSVARRDFLAGYARKRFDAWDGGVHVDPALLARLTTPTLILVGEDDHTLRVDDARALAAVLPDAEVRVLEGVGHWPMLEGPAAFVDAVDEFLARRGV